MTRLHKAATIAALFFAWPFFAVWLGVKTMAMVSLAFAVEIINTYSE